MKSLTLVTGVTGRHGSTGYMAECILQNSKEKLIARGVSNLLKVDAKK